LRLAVTRQAVSLDGTTVISYHPTTVVGVEPARFRLAHLPRTIFRAVVEAVVEARITQAGRSQVVAVVALAVHKVELVVALAITDHSTVVGVGLHLSSVLGVLVDRPADLMALMDHLAVAVAVVACVV
jgi:hypothetical protein